MSDDEYVLRDRDLDEVGRLGLQHEVWREVTDTALDLAGFRSGQVVADLGCGPGFLTLDLARRVGSTGRVLAADSSEYFLGVLRERASAERVTWIDARAGDVRDPFVEPGTLDGAALRWVLMFVDEAEKVVREIATALRPGGTVLALEYFQFRSIALHPVGEAFARTYEAVHQLISGSGGDPDIGGRLPSLFQDQGLEVTHIRPVLRVGRPGDPLWRWLEATQRNHSNLVDAGLLSEEELARHHREWNAAADLPGAFFTAPPVLVVVARRPPQP